MSTPTLQQEMPDLEAAERAAEWLFKKFGSDARNTRFEHLSHSAALEWRRHARKLLRDTIDIPYPEESGQDENRRDWLAIVMDNHGIEPNVDYQHEDLMEVLTGIGPVPRYAALTHDETYHFAHLVDTIDEACASLASSLGQDTGGSISDIVDLDTGKHLAVKVNVTVVLDDYVNNNGAQADSEVITGGDGE